MDESSLGWELCPGVAMQDSYLEAAFSEEQLLTVPMVPEGTEYQAQCVFRLPVGTGHPGMCQSGKRKRKLLLNDCCPGTSLRCHDRLFQDHALVNILQSLEEKIFITCCSLSSRVMKPRTFRERWAADPPSRHPQAIVTIVVVCEMASDYTLGMIKKPWSAWLYPGNVGHVLIFSES